MNIKKHIPNFLTCCNLLCGCLGILFIFYSDIKYASYFILLACIFDFFDGFAARLLNVTSPIGKELDSLADVISFGVLPSFILQQLLMYSSEMHIIFPPEEVKDPSAFSFHLNGLQLPAGPIILSSTAFLIAIFSGLRLAKFNIDTRQSDSFIGVPTPTNAILISSFPLILSSDAPDFILQIILNPIFLILFIVIMSYLLIAELPLFALKFKSFKWADNKIRYSFLLTSLILFIFLTWTAIPLIIFLYIILSFIENKILKPKS